MTTTRRGNFCETIGAHVCGVVTAVPQLVVTDAMLGDHAAAASEAGAITGVRTRRRASASQTTESLCAIAARRLLEQLGWSPGCVDALILVTQTPTDAIPSGAHRLHGELALPKHCAAIEVNWSCSGYVQGLWLASRLAEGNRRVLLLVGDTSSRIVDRADRATGPLFGDAGSATAVQGGSLKSHFVMGNDGRGAQRLHREHGKPLAMDGASVFTFALREVPGLIEDVLDIAPSPDYLLFHQANRLMLEQVIKRAQLKERFTPAQIPTNLADYGNCSCASIPLLLCDKVSPLAAKRSRFALFGFGAGWAWAGAVVGGAHLDAVELIEAA